MHPRFFPLLAVVAACVFARADTARAQAIELRDGTTVQALGLRRDGATLLAQVKTGDTVGEVGYPLANVARVAFPEPPQYKSATALLAQGKADEASRQLAPVLAYYASFYDVPGNWWKPLALLQLDALGSAHRDKESDALLGDLGKFAANDPDVVRLTKIKQAAGSLRRGDHQHALDLLMPVVKDETASPDAVAEAWVDLGATYLVRREFKPALLAYLHIPVYTPGRTLLMPPALLGSARAYLGLDDKKRAQDSLNELIAAYPASPEAAESKQQLQKLAARETKPAGN